VDREFPDHGLMLMGDLIDGKHHHTIQLFSADWNNHVMCAVECLKERADRARRVWAVRGTEVHVHRWEETIAQMLGAERHPLFGERCPNLWQLRVRGALAHFQHHIGVTGIKRLEAGGLGRALMDEITNYADAGWDVPRVAARSHRHVHGLYSNGKRLIVANPAWQWPTDYVNAKHAGQGPPQVGLVVLDWRNSQHDALPEVRTFLRSPPSEFISHP
jgi:hypothetical protein